MLNQAYEAIPFLSRAKNLSKISRRYELKTIMRTTMLLAKSKHGESRLKSDQKYKRKRRFRLKSLTTFPCSWRKVHLIWGFRTPSCSRLWNRKILRGYQRPPSRNQTRGKDLTKKNHKILVVTFSACVSIVVSIMRRKWRQLVLWIWTVDSTS